MSADSLRVSFQPSAAASAEAVLRAGVAALQRGAAAEARRHFDQLAAAGPPVRAPWLLLAQACRLEGDRVAEGQALDALLRAEPRNLAALLMKGDLAAATGDDRAASNFYQIAIGSADGLDLPPQMLEALGRAEQYLIQAQTRYEEHLRATLAANGAAPEAIGGRFNQAIDILTGRTPVYPQRPSAFYYPGLATRQFFDPAEFAWTPALHDAAAAILAELEAEMAREASGFVVHVEAQPGRPAPTNPLLGDPRWSSLYLWKYGTPQPDNQARFPAAMAALARAPMPHVSDRGPMVMFSRLEPHTHIEAHYGHVNTRLVCHLPLIVPPGCRFRVGSETRPWEQGRLTIFDDSIEHEAWNDGEGTRVVLLFDIWRPELSVEERQALTVLYESINLYDTSAA